MLDNFKLQPLFKSNTVMEMSDAAWIKIGYVKLAMIYSWYNSIICVYSMCPVLFMSVEMNHTI